MSLTNGSAPALEISFTISRYNAAPEIDRLAGLLHFVAAREGMHGEVGIWLCTDDEIADLHLRYMDLPDPTDVITFPEAEPGSGGYLGDIAVSVDTARVQAEDAGHSVEREIAFLCVHGLLHLAGYDDGVPEQRNRMIAHQEALLDEFERASPGKWRRETERESGNHDS